MTCGGADSQIVIILGSRWVGEKGGVSLVQLCWLAGSLFVAFHL